jgi:hypothetical protein
MFGRRRAARRPLSQEEKSARRRRYLVVLLATVVASPFLAHTFFTDWRLDHLAKDANPYDFVQLAQSKFFVSGFGLGLWGIVCTMADKKRSSRVMFSALIVFGFGHMVMGLNIAHHVSSGHWLLHDLPLRVLFTPIVFYGLSFALIAKSALLQKAEKAKETQKTNLY